MILTKLEKKCKILYYSQANLPEIKLDHLRLLTDDIGLFQHASFGIPDIHHGYSSDDVSRGLVPIIKIYKKKPNKDILSLISIYLSFLQRAQTKNGHFHNFMSFEQKFLDKQGSEDTFGRVIYGLGHIVLNSPTERMRALTQNMIEKSEPLMKNLHATRAKAYTICGLYAALKRGEEVSYKNTIIKHSNELVELYEKNSTENWNWFETTVTYGNAKICEALLCAFQIIPDLKYKEVGLATLNFLTEIQYNSKFFDIVGNKGWFTKDGEKAMYGQQPIDAGYLTEAYITAYEVTTDKQYLHLAHHAFEWFLGRNRFGIPLYDFNTGAVADGLDSHGISANNGAESIICFLSALLSLSSHSNILLDGHI